MTNFEDALLAMSNADLQKLAAEYLKFAADVLDDFVESGLAANQPTEFHITLAVNLLNSFVSYLLSAKDDTGPFDYTKEIAKL